MTTSPEADVSSAEPQRPALAKSLHQRHLTMIAIGGVVGAGLFVGSSVLLSNAGPLAFVSYAITGAVIVLIMRMLGEMSVADPDTGSFAGYARRAFGPWAGFSTGWLYWYFWVIGVGAEAVIGAKLLQRWIDAPSWIMAALLLATMLGTNLVSVKNFGEFEYWFASLKVAAIVVFLFLGGLFVFGLWPSTSMNFSNLTAHGGFAPNGVVVILSGVLVAVFSMVGPEIATIAAAESQNPQKAVTKAVNSVILRVGIFYIGSVLLLAIIVPWVDARPGVSPFVQALSIMGIPGGADIMNAVILISVLSVLNSGLYTASRMLFALSRNGDAPSWVATTTRRGVPRNALLLTSGIAAMCIVVDFASPETAFVFLLNSCGATILLVYLMIAASEIKLRRTLEREADGLLQLKMWLFPYLSIAAALAIVTVLASMFFIESTRSQILLSTGVLAIILIAYQVRKRTASQSIS